MKKETFFDAQTDLTASKISIYQQYLNDYLPKILMQYGQCFIADFFCGRGKNGEQNGSPLVLIDVAKKMLENPIIKNKWPNAEIVIVFSDENNDYCNNLKTILEKIIPVAGLNILGPFCEDFKSIKAKTIDTYKKIQAPKFFFLDPFTYSDIGIDDVKDFMNAPAAEVLLFLPVFHSYRFIKRADNVNALKQFLESFTDRGCANYEDIIDFNESIRRKLLSYVGLKYVRAICLDDGTRKNALFYLTKHPSGMILMNNLGWKYTDDGVTVKITKEPGTTLFNLSEVSSQYINIKKAFMEFIKQNKNISNTSIIDFVAQNCFTNKYANNILKEMKAEDLIDVEYLQSDKTRGFYVADTRWNDKLAIIKYKGG